MDQESRWLAAFIAGTAEDSEAKWERVLRDESCSVYVIERDGRVIGQIGSFWRGDEREVTYWVDRSMWGRGIARDALAWLLAMERTRPLFARVAADNTRSIRVLERAGFIRAGADRDYAPVRGDEIEELVFRLD